MTSIHDSWTIEELYLIFSFKREKVSLPVKYKFNVAVEALKEFYGECLK